MFGSSARKAVAGVILGLILGTSVAAQTGAWTLVGNVLTYRTTVAASNPAVRMRNDGTGAIAAFNYAGTDRWVVYQTYLNMSSTLGSSGYGFRNNSGVPEVKSSGGSWLPIISGTGGVTGCAQGGTGLSSYAVGDLIYASAAPCTLEKLADVATGSVLVSGGVGTAPAWSSAPPVSSLLVGAGLVGTPAVRFSGDPDNGLYYIGTNNWGLSAGGALALDVSTARVNAAVPVYLPDGSAGAPALAQGSDPDNGIYFGGNVINFATGGTYRGQFTPAGHFVPGANNTYDLGTTGIRYRNIFAENGIFSSVFQIDTALITSTGASTPSFGTNFIGGTGGPTTAAQNGWAKFQDSTGATIWVPVWK